MQSTADLSTESSREEVATLRRFIEHAPSNPGPLAADLRGWWTPEGNYVCNRCAGRIMARGCQLPRGSEPVWDTPPVMTGVCACCE